MAATDKPYREQNTLDIVFALSNILMLVSVVWMFWEDHYREYKPEQRGFRDGEAAMAQRLALDQIPGAEEFDRSEKEVQKARDRRDPKKVEKEVADLKDDLAKAESNAVKLQGELDKLTVKG